MALLDFNKADLNKKIRAGLGLSLVILALSALISFYSIQKLIEQSKLVDHTNEVLINLENIISFMKDAETGTRGYMAMGDEVFLEPYKGAYEKVIKSYKNTRALTIDNTVQQEYLDSLEPLLSHKFKNMQEGIANIKNHQKPSLEKVLEGKMWMDKARAVITNMQKEEKRLMATRSLEADRYSKYSPIIIAVSSTFALLVSIFSFYFISRDINNKERTQRELIRLNDELEAYNEEINKNREELNKHNYLLTGSSKLNDLLRGEKDLHVSGEKILNHLCEFMKAQTGILYILEEDGKYHLTNSYAFKADSSIPAIFKYGEGLLGQSALQRKPILMDKIPSDSIKINSGLFSIEPVNILIVPFHHNDQTVAVVELISKNSFEAIDLEYIASAGNIISIFINSIKAEIKTANLLTETQSQSEELQVQQEELKQMNEELEEQTQSLKHQQEELQVANEELEYQSQTVELKNKELEAAKAAVERQSKDLEMSSKYKSEFLANMSHELRTPLNSLLILSKDLADNRKKNLEPVQVESAKIIYNSGKDLLQLINEVLDLSKIEAGKMDLNVERLGLKELSDSINRNFKHFVSNKGIEFIVDQDKDIPEFIYTDRQRLDQILRNLISNAIKFTQNGSISVRFRKNSTNSIAIDVVDTGIGISEEKHRLIFEAFQQAEGGTSRKYGGTGLGLSISKELARLLGGYISLQSKINEGSTFTLIIPLRISASYTEPTESIISEATPASEMIKTNGNVSKGIEIPDDRNQTEKNDKSILIIEDDDKFATILLNQARQRKFKVLVATTGEEGLLLAQKYMPHAIILDLTLPGMNGKTVLAELKANPILRHIPVHIMSGTERTLEPIKSGAVEYLRKPVEKEQLEEAFLRMENFINRKMKNLLIIEDDQNSRKAIKVLIGNGDVKCMEAANGKEALEIIKNNDIDCVVLDLGLPDMTGFELIKKLKSISDTKLPPIIVYTGKDLTKAENDELLNLAETIIIKGVKSEERLLDETALFLHRAIENLPESKKQIITDLYDKETIFASKKILLVDDDMRNIFALSRVLKDAGMEIVKAENGLKALEALQLNPNIDLVLMDIMMPEMDGYEAMKQIRLQPKFKNLPIIALTAKAMKEDRNKCIEAGANDYISKPIEVERLLSLMRVWIKK
jgi:CheY-like chemotaxis protein/signal transduction histidine kinase/CHASE3 domain sensor protein